MTDFLNGVGNAGQSNEQIVAEMRTLLAQPDLDEATRATIQARLTQMETGGQTAGIAGVQPSSFGNNVQGVLGQNGQLVSNPSLNLTTEQLIMIQNFADRKPDAADEKGYKIRVVDANGNLSSKYYGFEDGVFYRKGDKDKKTVSFNELNLQLSERDYEAYLVALKEHQRKNGGRKLNELSDEEKEAKKPWLVRSADWLDKNFFGTFADVGGSLFPFIGTIFKSIGGVLTGLMRTLGHLFSGNFSEAGSSALLWLKDSAITAGVAWGASSLYKYFTKDKSSNSTTTTNSSTVTTNKTVTVSNVSGVSTENKTVTDRLKSATTATAKGAVALSKLNQNTK